MYKISITEPNFPQDDEMGNWLMENAGAEKWDCYPDYDYNCLIIVIDNDDVASMFLLKYGGNILKD